MAGRLLVKNGSWTDVKSALVLHAKLALEAMIIETTSYIRLICPSYIIGVA